MDRGVALVSPLTPLRGSRKPRRGGIEKGRATPCIFTRPGGQIWLAVERQGSEAGVGVRDDGAGIEPEQARHVFALFMGAERALRRSQGGIGGGLTLVRRFIELHGGTVEARSEGPDKGSEFTVRLPAPTETPAPVDEAPS